MMIATIETGDFTVVMNYDGDSDFDDLYISSVSCLSVFLCFVGDRMPA